MGVEVRPEFRPSYSGLIYQTEGKALVDDLEGLEEIAVEHGVTPLTVFMDLREPMDDFEPDQDVDGDPETNGDQANGPWTEWYPTQEGLTTVLGLLRALQSSATRARLSNPEAVTHDLEELAHCLARAGNLEAWFRLATSGRNLSQGRRPER